ncbi:MAG: PAS domain-containing sensor histidine kinase, partial [Betaproteobacteria bacterium]|nr:PAS domain-containing sensor histidine kinase [Betaproteobacteria bacterium]
ASAQSTQPMVHVWTELATSSQRVRLRIVDNGSGFSESVLQRAFEPYVTTKAGGTGLGLAVVKKIADEHQARIEIKNRLEGGETVGAQVSLSFRIANPAS